MHFLFDIFALWSLGFYILLAVFCLIEAALAEHEQGGFATLLMIAFLIGLDKLSHVPVFQTIRQHWLSATGLIVLYLLVGVAWSLGKWTMYCYKRKTDYKDAPGDYERRMLSGRPLPRDHKSRIMAWMGYWPYSMGWTFCDDVIGQFFNWAFERCEAKFDKISEKMFKDIKHEEKKTFTN